MLLMALLAGGSVDGFGQGQFVATSPAAPNLIYDGIGNPITTGNWFVDVIYGSSPGTYTQQTGVFQPLSGGNAGRFAGGTITTPFSSGTLLYVRVRSWQSTYPTYEAAFGNALVGASSEFSLTVNVSPGSVPSLSGMQAFTFPITPTYVGVVPEPSSVLLAGVGMGMLAFIRRRN